MALMLDIQDFILALDSKACFATHIIVKGDGEPHRRRHGFVCVSYFCPKYASEAKLDRTEQGVQWEESARVAQFSRDIFNYTN